MQKNKLFEELTYKDKYDHDELGMIIANNINIVVAGTAGILADRWADLIADILLWHSNKNKIQFKFKKNSRGNGLWQA